MVKILINFIFVVFEIAYNNNFIQENIMNVPKTLKISL